MVTGHRSSGIVSRILSPLPWALDQSFMTSSFPWLSLIIFLPLLGSHPLSPGQGGVRPLAGARLYRGGFSLLASAMVALRFFNR